MMNALLVSTDLMMTSHVGGAAERAGIRLQTATTPALAVSLCKSVSLDLVLIDLGLAAIDVGQLVSELRALSNLPRKILAFGPHVHTARLEAARRAGCDEVLSRGQLHGSIDELFRQSSGDA